MSWDGERVELLRKLWQDGISASRIAAQMGAGITRNAVIGKVHRLGLSGRAPRESLLPRQCKRPWRCAAILSCCGKW
jgi:GcrA cell cycle regulator